MCRSMVDIQSVAAEIRRWKKKKKKIEGRKKLQGKNIMAPLLHRAAITSNICTGCYFYLRWYLDYSSKTSRFFARRGKTLGRRGWNGVKFGVEGSTVDSTPNFTPSVQRWGCGPNNCKFYQILEYKCPAWAYPYARFLQHFHILSAVR